MTTQVDLNWSYVCTCAPPQDTEKREERTAARGTSGRYESSPCSIERHVGVDRARDLDLRGPGDAPPDYRRARRRRALAVDDDEQQACGDADDHRRDEEREAARPRGRGALEPVTCCGLMLRLGEKR